MFGHVDKFNLTLLSELETGIVILDASLKISSINSSALSFLDTSEKVAIGKQIDQIFYEEPDSLENFKESLKENKRFNKIDAMLHLKGEKKVLCNYSIHPI